MSCNVCQTKFSFFTREKACPNCGFSYCNRCLKYNYNIPNIGEKKICGPCYNRRKSVEKMNSELSASVASKYEGFKECLAPIDITNKLDLLENPVRPPIVMYQNTSTWDKFKTGLEPADQEIVERLKKLKGEEEYAPSIDEIRHRLAVLKDEDPSSNTSNAPCVDSRTDVEKVNHMIQEYLQILKLKAMTDPIKEIQDRLHALKADSSNSREDDNDDNDDDDNTSDKLSDNVDHDDNVDDDDVNVSDNADLDDDDDHDGNDANVGNNAKYGFNLDSDDDSDDSDDSDDTDYGVSDTEATKRVIKKCLSQPELESKSDIQKLEEMEVELSTSEDDDDDDDDFECTFCQRKKDLYFCYSKSCFECLFCGKCFNRYHPGAKKLLHHRTPFQPSKVLQYVKFRDIIS